MALNKFMHPRNLYKNKKPNFQELALKYPDFRKFVFPDVTGKLFLDFKHPDSLRQLSITLLEDDFGLKLELPLDRLVPTVPLRLNYIHWLEDIITASGAHLGKHIKGIDVGTGSSCIYPLLSCTLHKEWTFVASELDEKNFMYTQKNIETNGMKDRITVKKVNADDESVLCNVLSDEPDTFDFCMCNPPFFADHVEAQAVAKSRNYSRADPKSVCTASFTESIVEGGEVNFVKRMIKDSVELGTKIRIYSSMIGKKSSLPPLKEELRRLQVPKFSTTEFCQGKTMRWGLAWTFDKTVNFPKSLFQESKKERLPLVYQVPRSVTDLDYNVTQITTRIQALLTELKIKYDITLNQKSLVTMTLVAKENTWSNQRRKRREKLQQKVKEQTECSGDVDILKEKMINESGDDSSLMKKSKCEELPDSGATLEPQTVCSGGVIGVMEKGDDHQCKVSQVSKEDGDKELLCKEKANKTQDAQNLCTVSEYNKESVTHSSNSTHSQCEDNILGKDNSNLSLSAEKGRKRKLPDQNPDNTDKALEPSAKPQLLTSEAGGSQENVTIDLSSSSSNKAESTLRDKTSTEEMVNGYSELFGDSAEEKIFLKCLLKVKLSTPHVVMEMMWVDGEKRELMHQVLQYLKNKLSTDVTPVLK